MDEQEIKDKLVGLGISSLDAITLIKIAKNKKTTVTRVFISNHIGLYIGTAALVGVYFLFASTMSEKELISFSAAYIPVLFIIYFLTPFLKEFFWSLKVLFSLKGM
ncbi:hypothetical protein PL78_18765 [Yersinia entomophaga]|uniref:Uncharacterized protein n=1 Tax=Yersinia entomophaga TaxID=935293 RepID=A0ABN4PY20_YERET|nr:hypothetical protein [Yersinia entomophaga]ANI31854.1 hypothetical protein PL78_18765 [Yersinia entomophaga]OWF86722.1 hypothetical protein B4914_14155 [Yersinia entomophaga]